MWREEADRSLVRGLVVGLVEILDLVLELKDFTGAEAEWVSHRVASLHIFNGEVGAHQTVVVKQYHDEGEVRGQLNDKGVRVRLELLQHETADGQGLQHDNRDHQAGIKGSMGSNTLRR